MITTFNNLKGIREMLRHDYDWVCLVTGYEGVGKSTLALHICRAVDDAFNVDHICFSAEEFFYLVEKLPKYSAILVDEGTSMLFSRDSMKKSNKQVVKALTMIRFKNLFICICVPHFYLIDKYIREDRARCMFRVLKRGVFGFYSQRLMGRIQRDIHTQDVKYPQPSFFDSFPKFKKDDPMWIEYLKKKESFKLNDDSVEKTELRMKAFERRKDTMSLKEAIEVYGVARNTITNRIKEGKLDATRDSVGRWRVDIDSLRKNFDRND